MKNTIKIEKQREILTLQNTAVIETLYVDEIF